MRTHDEFVDHLASNPAERLLLKEVARRLQDNPFAAAGGRLEAILDQLAQPAVKPDGSPFSGEESFAFITDFAGALGVPPDVVTPALFQIGDIDLEEIPTEQIEDAAVVAHLEEAMRVDIDGYAKSQHAQDEYRAALGRLNTPRPESSYWTDTDDRRLAEIEQKYMRAEPGSENWKAYWRGPLQAEYAGLLERKMAPLALPEHEIELATGGRSADRTP